MDAGYATDSSKKHSMALFGYKYGVVRQGVWFVLGGNVGWELIDDEVGGRGEENQQCRKPVR
jgi:hypothetical protein